MPPVKREPSPEPPTPYQRKKAQPKEPNPKSNPAAAEGRQRLVELVIERGIAAVMGTNIAATQAEVGSGRGGVLTSDGPHG